MSRRPGWGLALIAVVVAAVCVRLGLWQLDRLEHRRTRNAGIAARRALPAVALEQAAGLGLTADSLAQRRVTAVGVYDWAHERVWPGRTHDGAPGVALLTPLRLADGSAVFVDRGWVPSPDAQTVDRAAVREPDSARVLGLAQHAPRAPGDVDPVALVDSLPYALRPIVLVVLPDSARPVTAGMPVLRWPAPVLSGGPHLSYAIQWFAFAVIAVGGAIAVLRRRN